MPFSCPSITGFSPPRRFLILTCSRRAPRATASCGGRAAYCRLLGLLAGLIPLFAHAAVWTVEPSIDLSTSYTDNVTLAAAGQEKDDYVLGVVPGISVRADGHELSMLFNYSYEQLIYANDRSRDYSRQLFQGRADAVLVPDLAYLSGAGRISQQLVDPTASAGLGELAVSENVGEVSTWKLSPSLRRSVGNVQLSLGTNFDIVDYPGRSRDSYSREYRFDAGSNGQSQPITEWLFGVSRREIFNEGDVSDQWFETINGLLRYHLTSEWAAEASAGYVRNNYEYDPLIAESPEGETWSVGLIWTPNPRTVVSGGVGEHYFGSTQFANIEHRSRYNTLQYSYVEEISSARQLQVDQSSGSIPDENGDVIRDPETGEPVVVDLLILSQTTEIFLAKRNKLNWEYRNLHVSFGIGAFHERRHLQSSGGTETLLGGSVGAGWYPSSRSSFTTSYTRQTAEFIIGREDVFRDVKLEANRRFHPKISGTLQFLQTARDSTDSAVTDYINHVVSARVRILF